MSKPSLLTAAEMRAIQTAKQADYGRRLDGLAAPLIQQALQNLERQLQEAAEDADPVDSVHTRVNFSATEFFYVEAVDARIRAAVSSAFGPPRGYTASFETEPARLKITLTWG